MSDTKSKDIIDATSGLIRAVEGLVRATATVPDAATQPALAPQGVSVVRTSPLRSDLKRADSPAWLDHHHPDGARGVKALGTSYHDAHMAGQEDAAGRRFTDPSLGATWKDLARIYTRLFASSEAFNTDSQGLVSNDFQANPFDGVRTLQQLIASYQPDNPDAKPDANFRWPKAGVPTLDPSWTIGDAISEFLAIFNTSPDNTKPDRSAEFRDLNGNTLAAKGFRLSHGQLVQLRHVFTSQEDLRLLAPYDVIGTKIW